MMGSINCQLDRTGNYQEPDAEEMNEMREPGGRMG